MTLSLMLLLAVVAVAIAVVPAMIIVVQDARRAAPTRATVTPIGSTSATRTDAVAA